jgi:hypothetical protein
MLDVDVSIVARDGALTATLVVGGPIADSRTLTSESCSELTDALAVVIARLASFVEPPKAIVEIEPALVRTDERRSIAWNAGIRLDGIVGTGGAPDLGIAAGLGVWGTRKSLSLEIAVSRWKANSATVADSTMAGVDVSLDALAVRAGWRPANRHIRGWIVGELGSMEGVGVQLDGSRRGSARWSAVGAGAALAWPVADHVALVGAGEVEFLIDHVKFALDSGSVLYRTPAVAVRASLGIEVGWH